MTEQIDVLKGLLRDPLGDIRLEDLLSGMASSVSEQFTNERFPSNSEDLSISAFAPLWIRHVRDYEAIVSPLLEPARLIGSYGLSDHAQVWKRFMGPIACWGDWTEGLPALVDLRRYPALLLVYTTAIATGSRDNYGPLLGMVAMPQVRNRPGSALPTSEALVIAADVRSVVGEELGPIASALAMSDDGTEVTAELVKGLVSTGSRRTPMSDHLHAFLRPSFRTEFSRDDEWDVAFARAEVMLDALATDIAAQDPALSFLIPGGFGRYTWRAGRSENRLEMQLLTEADREGSDWPPVNAGLFGGQTARAIAALKSVVEIAETTRRGRW